MPSLFEGLEQPAAVSAALPEDPGATVVVKSHTRHIRKGIDKRNKRMAPKKGPTLAERFTAYHAANPQVYARLVAMARELRRKGLKRYGIAALWEVLRYQSLTTKPDVAKCHRCGGSGYWIETTTGGYVPADAERGDCSACHGSGQVPTGAEPFKLSNNHRAYYARLIHSQEPDLNGFFRIRSTKS